LGISYRQAWLLVNDMNNCFRASVIEAKTGGPDGGGATLTPLGNKLVERYRAIEARALAATSPHLHDIEVSLKKSEALRPTTSIKLPLRSRG
jgi:molybdate transport system regulatory protein